MFEILYTYEADEQLKRLETDKGLRKRHKAVIKALRFLASNPKHPGLHTHEFTSLLGPRGEKVSVAYAEQKTPAAYRIFWHYGPGKNRITVISITPHP